MNVLFLGGDIRQYYASEYLKKSGINSEVILDFAIDDNIRQIIGNYKFIVLPLPVLKDGAYLNIKGSTKISLKQLFEIIGTNKTIIGGMFPDSIEGYDEYYNLNIIDYYDYEHFKIYNAYLSAEGAVFYAKKRMEKSIRNSKIAIMGYGRIGKILSHILKAQGANVVVFTRKDLDRVWSSLAGFQSEEINKVESINTSQNISDIDVIFNTIPSHIFNETFARNISSDTIIIDIASHPFGIDEKLVERYSLKYFKELGIPGRYAPQSSGEALGKIIFNIVNGGTKS